MKTLIELKQAAESKGLRFEVNKWDPTIRRWETDKVPNPDFMKIEIGIEYRPNIWAWFDGFCKEDVKDKAYYHGRVVVEDSMTITRS